MKTTKWTPERDQLLRTLRAMDISCQKMLARINDGLAMGRDFRDAYNGLLERAAEIGRERQRQEDLPTVNAEEPTP